MSSVDASESQGKLFLLLQYIREKQAIFGVFASISMISICFAIFFFYKSIQNHEAIEIVMGEATGSALQEIIATIQVDIGGGVTKPGVYSLPVGLRIADAIEKAGGLSIDADKELIERSINRAQKIIDGAKIYIPKKSEGRIQTQQNISSVQNTSHNFIQESSAGFIKQNTSHNILGMISINSASQDELESLSGVGPVTAKKIINGRPYMRLEELMEKKVIGKKLFEKIQSQISL